MTDVDGQIDALAVRVSFIDEFDRTLGPGERVTFGRAADLVIDTHRSLHRQLGLIENDGNYCWLANIGRRIPLVVQGEAPFRAELASGDEITVPVGQSVISFSFRIPDSARFTTYQIDLEVIGPQRRTDRVLPAVASHTTTQVSETVGLTPSLRVLLTALAEPRLRMTGERLPSTAELSERTGYAPRTIEKAIGEACRRVDREGTLGLFGTVADPKRDRREVLVRVLLQSAIITRADLALLDGP